jgi:hypothetical protein
MTADRDPLDPRLAGIDPWPPDARPRAVASTAWGAEIRDRIVRGDGPGGTRSRARRTGGVVLAGLGVAALAALMAVLIVAGGGPEPGPAPATATYRAAAYEGGPALSEASLAETVRLLEERGRAMGLGDLRATVDGEGRVAVSAPAATAAQLERLTGVGRLGVYARERAFVGEPKATAAAAARAARPARDVAIVREHVHRADGARGTVVRYQAVRGEPALTEADVASAAPVPGRDPEVTLTFTPRGEAAFERLTRTLAQDGALTGRLQSFAVVVDGVLITSPTLDFRQYPAGIDGRNGLSVTTASRPDADGLAARLSSGPLPLALSPVRPAPGWG